MPNIAVCRYADCRFTYCRGAVKKGVFNSLSIDKALSRSDKKLDSFAIANNFFLLPQTVKLTKVKESQKRTNLL